MMFIGVPPFFKYLQLPVVIKVPKLAYLSVMSVCLMPVSRLGFGDIIVPGKQLFVTISVKIYDHLNLSNV